MCGIAGFIAGHGAANAAALAPMLARIAHRGPDGQGTFVEGPAALGHCRLAIIDLEGGAQPLYSEDKNLVVVFNGEIYNYRALTAELTALGHTFATRTDTEVLLHGWEQWGRELLPRLRGMFAFALWDRRAGVLFCARDMFGIKPLYYCRCADGTLLFASEIKAFLDHPSFAKRLNTAQLPLYLSCQYSPGRDTFFAGVQKLLPGHFLEFSDGIVRTTRWVQPAFLPGDAPVSPAEIEEVLRGSAAAANLTPQPTAAPSAPATAESSEPVESPETEEQPAATPQPDIADSAADAENIEGTYETTDFLGNATTLHGYDAANRHITISDAEFYTWMDVIWANPADYDGWTLTVTGEVDKASREMDADEFIPARLIMTCCAADLTPCGFVCKWAQADTLATDTWVTVTGTLYQRQYADHSEPQLQVQSVAPAEPVEGYIYPYY